MNLSELRSEIDKVDKDLVTLFVKRMGLSAQVASYKKENNMPIHIPSREKEKLLEVGKNAGPKMKEYTQVLYSMLFELSRSYQTKQNAFITPLFQKISSAIEHTPKLFPQDSVVACQGTEGTYAEIACEKLFKHPDIVYFNNFNALFSSVEQGLCQYGILPIENSSEGSMKKIYDLMIQHNFFIVRAFQMKISHNLLALPGSSLSSIKEIYSHEHAIRQCSEFLKAMPDVKIIPVENTAVAAEMVAKSGRADVAALSSCSCIDLYGLTALARSVQDPEDNRTRFICISKNLEIYPGADRSSIMMILPHKPGALYKVLARLYVLGINILKLESRSIPNRDFEFCFYFDLETSIYSDEFIQLMCELDDLCNEFSYLGSYTEVI